MTSITPSGIITELSQIIVFEKQTIKKEFQKNEIHSWQKTEDMIKYPSRQRNDNKILTQKMFEKNLKKVLDKQKRDEIK